MIQTIIIIIINYLLTFSHLNASEVCNVGLVQSCEDKPIPALCHAEFLFVY